MEQAVKKRFDVDKSGEIIVLEFCPWKDHLLEIEKEMGIEGTIKYCLFKDTSGKWRVQCVPISANSFTNRLSLPKEWCGLRDEELSKKSGIPNCIFVRKLQ